MFVDDSLVVLQDGGAISQASEQCISHDKSSILFNKAWPNDTHQVSKNILHVPNESLSKCYLGLPSDAASSRNGWFKYLKDCSGKSLLNGLKISVVYEQVLVNVVAQIVPVVLMSHFKLLRGLCEH